MKNLDQKRAARALDNINHVGDKQSEYGSLAKSLPMMLQTNDLAQTMAFIKSKAPSNFAHQQMFNHLSQWLNRAIRNEETDEDFLEWIVSQDTKIYRQAAGEAIEFSIWLRRFTEAKGWE
jgi:CRISPR type III-B/RAMP module-associated protein Cmr5